MYINNILVLFNQHQMDMLYEYFIQGILDARIIEDGGPECYDTIPKLYHIVAMILAFISHYLILKNHSNLLLSPPPPPSPTTPSILQLLVSLLGIISLSLTLYFKLLTHKGAFILNPCHISLLMIVILLMCPTTPFTRKLHVCWTTWIFGAIMALSTPHLYGVVPFQVYLYYLEHILIVPIGPLILYRRYGFPMPTLSNQVAGFTSMVIHQVGILAPFGILTTVNLNFALCHSPQDPFYPYVGYHYFALGVVVLNIFSYLGRWVVYAGLAPVRIWQSWRQGKFDSKQQ